ncbi:MAG: phosphonate ABC transporter substrate-binding protein [Deltaproteobacteria bacterium]|nr:phosphonate ABC transporter substrate-binding protein [Deltaproteobacteria bacterium]
MYGKKLVISTLLAALMIGASTTSFARDLVMGLIPAENNEEMVKKFEPMRAYLEKKLGQKIKVFTATDYTGVIEGMKKKRVDIAWFGPLSYYLAELEAGAEAFAVGVMQNGKSTYRSLFVVPGDSPARSLKDLKGKSVAFVDPASTSGGLMPTYLVKKETGMMPEQFFGKFIWTGSHDAVEMAVKNKTVDAGADNDITYPLMLEKGLITKESNRVLMYSPELPGSPLTYRKDLPVDLKKEIQDAIVNAHKEIDVTGYGKIVRYDPVKPSDYQMIRDMVKELGLKKEQMLK